MLDTFRYLHRHIRFTSQREDVRESLFQIEIPMIIRMRLNNYWDPILEQTLLAQIYEKVFDLAVEELTKDLMYRNFSEHLILEVVTLHCIQMELKKIEQRESVEGRAVAILGAMIQHRLALFLASATLASAQYAFEIGMYEGFIQQEWENAFTGAAAMAKVMKAWQQIENVQIFLPTIHEDVDIGIDLFVLKEKMMLGLSLKAGRNEVTWAELIVSECNETTDRYGREKNSVYTGVRKIGPRMRFYVWAVLAHVGKTRGVRYEIIPEKSDTEALEQIFSKIQRINRPHAPALVSSS